METSSPVEALSHFATHAPRLKTGGLISAMIFGIIGAMIIFVTPGFLAVVAAQSGMDDAHLGYIAAWDINAMGVTIAISAFLLTRCNWRMAMALAMALVAIGNIGTALATGYAGIALARVVAGAGEGIAVGFAFAALGRAANPDRAFSFYLVAGALFSSLVLYFIPSLLVSLTPQGIFIANGLLAVAAGLCLFQFPDGRDEDDMFAAGGRIDRELAVLALLCVFLFFFAVGAIWSYAERIGMNNGLPASTIAHGLSLGTLAGVAGAGLAGVLPQRWGRIPPLILSGIITIASFQLLLGQVPPSSFILAIVLMLFGWNFAQPLLSGLCSQADRCGRVVCAMGAIQTFGTGLGPAAAGATLYRGDFTVAIWGSCAVLLASITVVVVAIHRARAQ